MATAISQLYRRYATNLMSLSITENEMYILIPSENDIQAYYRVDLDEETMQAKGCCCRGFCRWQRCKHCAIVNEAFAGYVAPVVEPVEPVEPKVTEVEPDAWYIVNADTQVWMNEGEWLAIGPTENAVELVIAHLEKQSAIAEAERIVQLPAGVAPINGTLHVKGPALAKTADISTKGNFGSKAFDLLKVS